MCSAVAAAKGRAKRDFSPAEPGPGALLCCWTVKDQVVAANEPWFGSAAIEQALRECRDDPSGGAQQAS